MGGWGGKATPPRCIRGHGSEVQKRGASADQIEEVEKASLLSTAAANTNKHASRRAQKLFAEHRVHHVGVEQRMRRDA